MKGRINQMMIGRHLPHTLRNTMTDAEIRLWQRLRGGNWRRAANSAANIPSPILFVWKDAWLLKQVAGDILQTSAIEIHAKCLRVAGFQLSRFRSNEVWKDSDAAAVEEIRMALQPHPHPGPPLEGEGVCVSRPFKGREYVCPGL